MNMDEVLQDAFGDLAARAPHDESLAGTIQRRSRYRRAVTVAPLAAAVAVIAVVGAVLLVRPVVRDQSAAAATLCTPIQTAVLPSWARAGFSEKEPRSRFVTSTSGAMVAIVFADPLISPARPDVGNKILWVPNTDNPAASIPSPRSDYVAGDLDLHITGRLENGTATMHTTVVGGSGPSIVNVPQPGCWKFDLTWGNRHDTINIPYARG
jgi:hypothetical protein